MVVWGCGCFNVRVFFGVGLLWWGDIGQGNAGGCSAAAELVVFHVHKEPAFGADPLSSVPVRACFDGVETLFTGYLE